jgi:DNA-binding response OmpR family regulator
MISDEIIRAIISLFRILLNNEEFSGLLRAWLRDNAPELKLSDKEEGEELPLPADLDERAERVWNYLLEHRGEICRMKDLTKECVMSEGMIMTAVSQIRTAIGETWQKPRWLVTHRGIGYELRRKPLSAAPIL